MKIATHRALLPRGEIVIIAKNAWRRTRVTGVHASCSATGFERIRSELRERLFEWLAGLRRRTTVSDRQIEARTDAHRQYGVHIGIW